MSAQAAKYKDLGNEEFNKGNFEKAIENYTYATEIEPSNHIYFTNRANAHFQLQNFSKSLRDAAKSVELNPKWDKGHYRMGVALTALEQHAEALSSYQTALSLQPDNQSYVQVVAATKIKLESSQIPSSQDEMSGKNTTVHMSDSVLRSAVSRGPEDRVEEEANRLFQAFETRKTFIHPDRMNQVPSSVAADTTFGERKPLIHPDRPNQVSQNTYTRSDNHASNRMQYQNRGQRPPARPKQPYFRDTMELNGFFKASFLQDPWVHMLTPQQAEGFQQQQLQIQQERQKLSHKQPPPPSTDVRSHPPKISHPAFVSPDDCPAAPAPISQKPEISLPTPKLFDLPPPKKDKRVAAPALGHDEDGLVNYSSDSDKEADDFDEFGERVKKKKKTTSIFSLPPPKKSSTR